MRNKFELDKLKMNAVDSIRLGVEDFELSKNFDGDRVRVLSAARNIYAGILLLFKYAIIRKYVDFQESKAFSKRTYENSNALIHKITKEDCKYYSPWIISDGALSLGCCEDDIQSWGHLGWRNKSSDYLVELIWPDDFHQIKTIDVEGIKSRFKSFGIKADWCAVKKLQVVRNELEHGYSEQTPEKIAVFIRDTFSILYGFINEELKENPYSVLGNSLEIMKTERDLYEKIESECHDAWRCINIPDGIEKIVKLCRCDSCSSELIRPVQAQIDIGLDIDSRELKYVCKDCGWEETVLPQIYGHFKEYRFGKLISECSVCLHDFFVVEDGACSWCNHNLAM